jgi:glycosyltransferase involved in cell wall biosynthesis
LALHQSLRIREELEAVLPQASFVKNKSIAVLLPCYNEEATVAAVIESFRRVLPGATIYVYDNNSADRTAEVAAAAGAVVRRERYQGKGNVVRRMFADIEADIYVLADGDLTYDASAAGRLVDALVSQNVDMVVGVRVASGEAFPRGHQFGNRLFNRVVSHLFGDGFTDILSGYRVMSRRFAKSFPAASRKVLPGGGAAVLERAPDGDGARSHLCGFPALLPADRHGYHSRRRRLRRGHRRRQHAGAEISVS